MVVTAQVTVGSSLSMGSNVAARMMAYDFVDACIT